MTELGRRSPWHPFLLQAEGWMQALSAHASRYWALWLALLVAMVGAAIGLYAGLERLATRWDYPYDHSWLVLGMTAWLLRRAVLAARIERIAPSAAGLVVLAALVLGYGLLEVLDVSLGMHVVLPLMVWALVASLAGLPLARVAAVPLAMLYFTIPIWDLTIPPLQEISSSVVKTLVGWTGLVAYTVGNLITIPSGSFEIAEGCSGMRYFLVSLAITAFIGLSWYERWRTRLLLMAVAGLAAMASNWIRIYTLILIGDATDMQHYVIAKSHDGYGWLVYVVFLLPVLWFARVLDKREPPEPRAVEAPRESGIAPNASFIVFGLMAAAILASPALMRGDSADPPPPADVRLMPFGGSGWIPVATSDTWQPQFRSPYFSTHEALQSESDLKVDVYVARYLRQRPGSKLVSTRNRVSPQWQVTASGDREVSIGTDVRRLDETEVVLGSERRLVWHWFLVGGKPTHERLNAKLLEVGALARGRRDGAVIALSAPCGANCNDAAAGMSELIRIVGPKIEALANGAGDQGELP